MTLVVVLMRMKHIHNKMSALMMTYWSDASQDNEIFVIEEVDIRNDTKANDGESKDLYN